MTRPFLSADRCGQCDNCKHVEATGRIVMPNPPFKHATSADVELWNKTLKENPCLNSEQSPSG